MRELHFKFLQSRKFDLINLVKCPDTVINVLINCNIISQDFTFKSFTFETVIDQICQHSNYDLFLLFILILLLTGNFKAYLMFLNIMDKGTLKKMTLPNSIKTLFNPLQLSFIPPTPSLPAKQCLRKFSIIPKMSETKKNFLQNLLNLMELNLNLEPILIYLKFYEIFADEQILAIKGSKKVIKSFIDYLGECPDIAFERFTHALVLSEQWILFSILEGGGLLDLSLLEEISKIHMELILDHENNKENSTILSYQQSSISFQDPIILSDSIEEPPRLPENFEVDETDSKILATLYQKDEVYPNFSSPKGLALIINNREFANNQYNPRTGTEVDEENIRKLLFKLGYQVERTHKNLSAESMLRSAKIFAANEAHKNFDSCVVVVLTHGQYDHFIGSDGDGVNVHDFLGCFNAKNAKFLKGKPKLFFFQACRGDNHDYGTDTTDIGKISSLFSCMRSSPTRQRNFNNNTSNNHFESNLFSSPSLPSPPSPTSSSSSTLTTTTTFPVASSLRFNSTFSNSATSKSLKREKRPTEGDMVIAFATTPRYVSWRNSNSGSWFIQSICEIFGKFAATEDIGSLLIKVNKRVADAYQSSSQGQKQIPEFVIRLQKKFYFFPGIKAQHLQQSK